MKKVNVWLSIVCVVVIAAIALSWFVIRQNNRDALKDKDDEKEESTGFFREEDTSPAGAEEPSGFFREENVSSGAEDSSGSSQMGEVSSGEKEKQKLTKVECYDGTGKLLWTKQYEYNNKGLVSGFGGQVLTYDNKGNLLWQVSGEPYDQVKPGFNTGVRYQYNAQGQLVNMYKWEGGATETTYEYDSSGKLIRSYDKNDFLNTECAYYYDAKGYLVKTETTGAYTTGEKYYEVCQITNDEQGRPIEERYTGGQGDKTVYWDYFSSGLVIKEYDDEYGTKKYVELYNEAGQRLDVLFSYEIPCGWSSGDNVLKSVEENNADGSIK